jgi:hypothetical protein
MQQRAAAAVYVQQRAGAAGSTIAMGDSDGSSQPAAQLRWAAVAAAAVQRTAGRRENHDEQQLLSNCGSRRVLGGAVATKKTNYCLPFFSNQWTWHQQQDSGDGSSGARGVRAAVCSSGGVGVAASSVGWWSCRQRRTGARSQWMAGSQRACGSGQRMGCACNSVQQSGMCATACSGSGMCVAAGGSSEQHDCNGRQ